WVAELETYADDGLLINALNSAIDQAEDYPEAPDCCIALAAAEVVAALLGKPVDDCPDEVDTWIQERPAPSASLIAKARQAAEVVLASSELKDLWAESDEFEAWQASVEGLLSRLPY
ncbi:MAG: DUF4259 domain-containing protein, partial [Acaryochloris sp. RU_4_1]|nr:DUF4259 domain-containing protein [Acaryochloris sp. RU_4_1]